MTTCMVVERTAGDTGPDLYSEFEGVDITGWAISLTVRYESGGELNKPAVIDDALTGKFHFEWGATDLVAGNHRLEYTLNTGATVRRIPAKQTLALIVREQA